MDFYSEQAIEFKDDDKFDRFDFAKNLAESISNYDGNCLTIGLIGKWGSGKTSIINLTKTQFDSENLIIIDFNPWYFSTQDNLYQQFFNLILGEIEKREFGDKFWIQKKWIQLQTQWQNISKIEIGNKDIIQYIKEIGLTLRELEQSNIVNKYYNQVKSNSSININMPGFGYTYNFEDSIKEYNSIYYLKTRCNEYFKSLNYKFLIIIDDLDRMTKTEIEQTLILVKSLANFDNFIYLLAFDDEVVSESLSDIPKDFQKLFLEKIIQVPITIPKFSTSHLNELFTKKLEEFYEKFVIDEDTGERQQKVIEKEFLEIYLDLKLFFENPRDLYRYINILNFNFPIFKDEVNRHDFLLILAIQLFETDIYHEIKNNKKLFLANYFELNNDSKKLNKDKIDKIVNLNEKLSENMVKTILFKLFPKINSYYTNINYVSNWDKIWNYECKICSNDFFDKYFTLTLETNEISMVSIINLLNSKDINYISETILEFNSTHKTKNFFDLLSNRIKDVSKENTPYLISSLIDIGDLLNIPENLISSTTYLYDILNELLSNYDSKEEIFEVLKNAISNSKQSLYTAVYLLSSQDFIYNRFNYENDKEDISKALIDENNLEKLEDIMVLKIRQWDETGQLWDSPNLNSILYSWEFWDKEIDVKERVNEFISENKNVLRFARGFRNIKTTTHYEIIKTFDLKNMLKYFDDIKDLKSKYIEIFNNNSLNDDEKEICDSLIKQIDEWYK